MVSNMFELSTSDVENSSDKSANRVVSCEKIIEDIGFGKVQRLVFVCSFLILGNTVAETMGISYVLPAAVCDLNLTPSNKGLLTGMTFFGVMAGSHFFGFLADTKGRRKVILCALLGSTISTCLSVFMANFTVFVILRFISGFCVAGYSAVIYAYLGEYIANKHRASMLSWVTTSVGFSIVIMPLLAYWIIRYEWRFELYEGYEFRPWRLLLLLYSMLGVVGGLMLLTLKESPRFLLTIKKDEEALEIIRWIYRTNKGTESGFDVLRLESEGSGIAAREEKGFMSFMMSVFDQTWTLLKPPHAKYFLACSCLHFGLFAVSGGIALFMPDILNKLAIGRNLLGHDLHVCDVYDIPKEVFRNATKTVVESSVCVDTVDLSIYIQSITVGVGYLLGFIVVSIIIRPHTRVYILAFNYTVAAISGVVLTFLTSSMSIVTVFTMFIFFTGVNVSVVNSAAVDIFPTFLRSMAICCSMMFGRLGTTISTNLLGFFLETSCTASIYGFAALCGLCCAVSFVLPRSKAAST